MDDRIILGLTEEVVLEGNNGNTTKIKARIDSGAQNSSIDQALAAELQLGPILKNKVIKQSHGQSMRPVVHVKVNLEGKEITEEFTISNRSHMKFKALIGQNILRQGFLIDPSRE